MAEKRSPLPPRDKALLVSALGVCALVAGGAWWLAPPAKAWLLALALCCGAGVALNLGVLKRPIFPYDRILSAFSADGLEWSPEPGVRLDVGGLHRSAMVYHPEVVWSAAGGRMFYRAGGARSCIGSAVSADGLDWNEVPIPRFEAGGKHHLRRLDGARVVGRAASWRIYYAGTDGQWWRIYTRESPDLVSWGEELCCLDLSREQFNTFDPSVVVEGEGLALYFLGVGGGESRFWRVFSADGVAWSTPVACSGYETEGMVPRDPCVVSLEGGGWRMYFSEHPPGTARGSRLVSARSAEGRVWQREPGARLLPQAEDGVHGVFCPSVVRVEGGWRMYYGSYWGRHWLEPLTLLAHSRARS